MVNCDGTISYFCCCLSMFRLYRLDGRQSSNIPTRSYILLWHVNWLLFTWTPFEKIVINIYIKHMFELEILWPGCIKSGWNLNKLICMLHGAWVIIEIKEKEIFLRKKPVDRFMIEDCVNGIGICECVGSWEEGNINFY